MATHEIKKQVEALLFSCGRKMETEEIGRLIGINSEKLISDTLKQLKNEYAERDSPIMLTDEGSAWKLAVREPYLPLVRKINPYTEFPKSVMETLAVVAWKQPILQSTVIKFRTNKAYDHIDELINMGFIVKEKYGRTAMLKLTQKFYDYFDLQDRERVKDLFKRFKDEDKLEQKRVDEFEKQKELDNPSLGLKEDSKSIPKSGIGREIAVKAEEKGETIEEEILDEITDAENKDDIEKEEEIISELGKIETEKKADAKADTPAPVKAKEEAIVAPVKATRQEQKKEPIEKFTEKKQPEEKKPEKTITTPASILKKEPLSKPSYSLPKSASQQPVKPIVKPTIKPIAKPVVKPQISKKPQTKMPAKRKPTLKKRR
jgi:segregation and condensation protein B